jgi:hypothetical protein
MFALDAARQRAPGPETVFMAESWSRCPATAWTGALLQSVWERAVSVPASPPTDRAEPMKIVEPASAP